MLYAIQPTAHGGETAYGNMYKAYETLPDDIKARIDGLKAHHAFTYNSLVTSDNEAKIAGDETVAAFEHPMVRTHPVTGRRALYVNRLMTRWIVGMEEEESRELRNFLYDHLENPEFTYEHREIGSILMRQVGDLPDHLPLLADYLDKWADEAPDTEGALKA